MSIEFYRGFNPTKISIDDDEVVVFIESLRHCKDNKTNVIGPYRLRERCKAATDMFAKRFGVKHFSIGGGRLQTILTKYSQKGSKKKFYHIQPIDKAKPKNTPRPIRVNCKLLEREIELRKIEHAKYKDRLSMTKEREINDSIKIWDMVTCVKNAPEDKLRQEISKIDPNTRDPEEKKKLRESMSKTLSAIGPDTIIEDAPQPSS